MCRSVVLEMTRNFAITSYHYFRLTSMRFLEVEPLLRSTKRKEGTVMLTCRTNISHSSWKMMDDWKKLERYIKSANKRQ